MVMFTKSAQQIFASVDENGAARAISEIDVGLWGTEIESVLDALRITGTFQGGYNASVGVFPDAGTAQKGEYWLVRTAGTISGTVFNVGDQIIALVDNASATNYEGNWLRIPARGQAFANAIDAGAGTANAVKANFGGLIQDGMPVVVTLYRSTTASPVTISINNGTPLTIKTAGGNDASALLAGTTIFGLPRASDQTFRLLTDQASALIVAQAEAARDEAVASLGAVVPFATKAIAAAATIPSAVHVITIASGVTIGDGLEARYTDDIGYTSDDSFTSSGPTARVWHRLWKRTFTAAGNGNFITINPKAFSGGTLITINSAIEDGRGGAAHSYEIIKEFVTGEEPDHIVYMGWREDGDANEIRGHYYGRQQAGVFARRAQWGNSSQSLSSYTNIACNTNLSTGAMFAVGHSWNDDFEQVTALPDNAVLGRFLFFGTDGVDRNSIGGWLEMRSDGAWSGVANPAKFLVRVTPSGKTSPVAALSIDNQGGATWSATDPTDGAQKSHIFVNAGGTSAGTALELRLVPSSGGSGRYASVTAFNYGSDDIGMDIRVSHSGAVLSAFRARGQGQIDYPTGSTGENPTSGYIGERYNASGFKRQRNGAGVEWTFATAPKTVTYNDDVDHAITLSGMYTLLVSKGTLTANRTYTIPNGGEDGQIVELFHKGSGAFLITLSGTGMSQAAALNGVAKAVWDATNATWNAVSYV